jgi:hypothetical protein
MTCDLTNLGPEFGLRAPLVGVNGIRMHMAEQGEGPLVLLAGGFPETLV